MRNLNIGRRKGVKKLPKVISKYIKSCPYCGSEEYYRKESYKGTRIFRVRFDGEEVDNSDMWDVAEEKLISQYAWCSGCNKRLFKLEE